MKHKLLLSFISIIFIFFFVVFFIGLKKSNIYVPSNQVNERLTNFETIDFFNEQKINSEDIFSENGFYIINIWASWCLPCKAEHPFLIKLKNETSVKIIGINYKDKNENASKFLKDLRNPYDKILKDKDGTISINLGAYGVPETFLIKNKKIIKKIIGPINDKKYANLLKKINE